MTEAEMRRKVFKNKNEEKWAYLPPVSLIILGIAQLCRSCSHIKYPAHAVSILRRLTRPCSSIAKPRR